MTPPASSAAHAAPAAPLRRSPAPRRPRRISGPARPVRPSRPPAPAASPARRAATESGGLILSVLGALEALSSHRALDRLIRGRLWIGIIAFALIGIVALQLWLLKLNTGIGLSLEKQGALQRGNAALAIENSELASGGRVESEAGRLGMRLTAVSGLKFHDSHARSDVPQAAAALKEAVKPVETHSEATETTTSGASAESTEAGSSTGGATAEESTGGTTGESSGSSEEASSSTATNETSEGATASAPPTEGTSAEAGGGTAAPGG